MSLSKRGLLAVVLISGICATPAFARGHHIHFQHIKPGPSPTPAKPIHEGVIKAIHGNSITVGEPGDTKSDRTYGIDTGINGMGGTDIYIDGVKSAVSGLKVGMAISVSGDLSRASSITAHGAPPSDKPAPEGKKKKGR